MQKIDRLAFTLDKNNMLTGILAINATDDDIELLYSKLVQYYNQCHSTVKKMAGNEYCITSKNQIVIKDLSKIFNFIQEQMSDFVNDTAFVRDKSADVRLDLLDALHQQLSKKVTLLNELSYSDKSFINKRQIWATDYEISQISTLITYIKQEKWDCHCENCGKIMLLTDILKTHNTFCNSCLCKEH